MSADSLPAKRITSNSAILGGKPTVRGTRVSVEVVLDLLSQGASHQDLIADYPVLEVADILACLAYAKCVLADEDIDILDIERRA